MPDDMEDEDKGHFEQLRKVLEELRFSKVV